MKPSLRKIRLNRKFLRRWKKLGILTIATRWSGIDFQVQTFPRRFFVVDIETKEK